MKRISVLILLGQLTGPANALEFSGNVAAEALIFGQSAQDLRQMDNNLTLSAKPKWRGDWNDGDDSWSSELFLRADGKDEGRNHADIRELFWLHLDGDNEWRIGINTMFWGVTESQHLVDVINQIDQVEGFDGEDKLGQPMIHLKRYEDWGVLDFLILPGFRERTFRSVEGRPRPPLVVDNSNPVYESSDEKNHIDYAIRYSQTYDQFDVGLSIFKGTNRDPELNAGFDSNGNPVLIPLYRQITQLGIDMQVIDEDWTWKGELIHRENKTVAYQAMTAGFEYTFYGVLGSDTDIGSLVEYSHDSRSRSQRGVFDRDIFFGARFALNDAQSTELLAGFILDSEKSSRSFRLEGNRRIGESWKATIEMQVFSNVDASDPLFAFADDDFMLLEMARYF